MQRGAAFTTGTTFPTYIFGPPEGTESRMLFLRLCIQHATFVTLNIMSD